MALVNTIMRKAEFISESSIYRLLKKDSSLELVCIYVCLFVCFIAVVPVSPFCHFRQHSQVRTKLANAMLMCDGNTNDTQLLSFAYFYKAGDEIYKIHKIYCFYSKIIVLENFAYQLGECKFNANEVVVGSNHETCSALKKDSITFSETSVRIYEIVCSHTRKVRNIDNCLLRH
jgi:hypothetical protein